MLKILPSTKTAEDDGGWRRKSSIFFSFSFSQSRKNPVHDANKSNIAYCIFSIVIVRLSVSLSLSLSLSFSLSLSLSLYLTLSLSPYLSLSLSIFLSL
jgi:hypothetical protein